MSRYGYFEVFLVSLGIRDNESRLYYIPERAILKHVTLSNMIIDRGKADSSIMHK